MISPFFVDFDELFLESGVVAMARSVDMEHDTLFVRIHEIFVRSCDGFPCITVEDGVRHGV